MSCDKVSVGRKDAYGIPLRCNRRKGHKGMCETNIAISWYGEKVSLND
jgi:hypothetical protein